LNQPYGIWRTWLSAPLQQFATIDAQENKLCTASTIQQEGKPLEIGGMVIVKIKSYTYKIKVQGVYHAQFHIHLIETAYLKTIGWGINLGQ